VRSEAISLVLREFAAETSDLRQTAGFFKWLADEHVVSQYILFSEDDFQLYRDPMTRGVVPDKPRWLLFVRGHTTRVRLSNTTPVEYSRNLIKSRHRGGEEMGNAFSWLSTRLG